MSASAGDTRNIAILAHVDAGKTTVSERLLYFSETIPVTGEVDEGLAVMDYLAEEKKRGITVEAGIASYTWKGVRVTFVDTPGHVDFGVEVDFALRAVEGVVLVLSGVGGIESQSLEAWEKIKNNGNRALIFLNKLDLPAADYRKVMGQIRTAFGVQPVALTLPVCVKGDIVGVLDVLNQLVLYKSAENPRKLVKGGIPAFLAEAYAQVRKELLDAASRFHDGLLAACLNGGEIKNSDVAAGLRAAMACGECIPVYMGSALRNAGIRQLLNGVNLLLPPPAVPLEPEPALGFVIKIRHYHNIGKIFLAKIFRPEGLARLYSARFFRVFAEALEEIVNLQDVRAGDIIALQSPRAYRMGEALLPADGAEAGHPGFAVAPKAYPTLLQSRIELERAEDHERVDQALRLLAETEPSISVAPDFATGGWLIGTAGELQLQIFCNRLKNDYKCDVKIGAPSVRYLERLKAPRVGLLSIGEEATKGNELTREAHRLLKASPLHFIGNVEARDVYTGVADVIVSDGFTGNVALKISEGLVEVAEDLLREELSSTFTMRVGSMLTARALRRFRRRMDYSEYGGAPLLGVAGVTVVGHGRSSAKAVRNAVAMAYRFASGHLIERVEREIANVAVSHR